VRDAIWPTPRCLVDSSCLQPPNHSPPIKREALRAVAFQKNNINISKVVCVNGCMYKYIYIYKFVHTPIPYIIILPPFRFTFPPPLRSIPYNNNTWPNFAHGAKTSNSAFDAICDSHSRRELLDTADATVRCARTTAMVMVIRKLLLVHVRAVSGYYPIQY